MIEALSFLPSSTHSAVLRVHNPTVVSWTYLIKLLIGTEEKASWTQVVAAVQTVDLTAVVMMPTESGSYAVTIKVVETSTNTDLGTFPSGSITIAEPVVSKLTIVDLSFIYYHSGYSGSTPYDDYTVQVQIRNDGNMVLSHVISFESWRSGYPAIPGGSYSYPTIVEQNRVSLSSGQVQTITMRYADGSLYLVNNLLTRVQGESIGTRVRALLDSNINLFSSEMFKTL